jgi:hypothetical protein
MSPAINSGRLSSILARQAISISERLVDEYEGHSALSFLICKNHPLSELTGRSVRSFRADIF